MKETAVLFGHGNLYERKIDLLKNKYDILAILDNAADGREMDSETGVLIRNPEYVKELCPDKIILLSYSLGEMAKQLSDLGIGQEKIVYGLFENPRNSFEEMLYDDGNGELYVSDGELWYKNSRINWMSKVDNSDVRSINNNIKDTILYPDAKELVFSLPLHPVDEDYGLNRGTPVDRFYIERFLQENSELVKGKVLEVGGRDYTIRFGGEKVIESDIIHKIISDSSKRIFRGDLETGEGLSEGIYDCFICTQTLPFIYDLNNAVNNIVKLLKPGGSALITAGGISQIITNDRRRYGHYWSFTDMSMERLFLGVRGVSWVKAFTYGNVKSASAFLYGLSWEELGKDILEVYDPEYQVIVAAVVRKSM